MRRVRRRPGRLSASHRGGVSAVELSDPVRKLVGGATAKVLADSLGLHAVGDLLRHFPRRYATRGELTDLSSLSLDEHVTVLAEVRRARARPIRAQHRRKR